ncbi:MAG: hypothetical protein KAU28_02035, partial [Phycisphaerae bacterium]|nr:hypothetical protein [Phycisphaerae bacterium]
MNEQKELKLEFEISQYLDGQLSRRRAAELESRLREDPALQKVFGEYVSLVGHIAQQGPEDVAIDYADQKAEILRAVERKMLLEGAPARRRLLRPVFGAMAAAAAVLVLATTAVLIFQRPSQPQSAVEVTMLPEWQAVAGETELAVELRFMDWDEVDLASAEE